MMQQPTPAAWQGRSWVLPYPTLPYPTLPYPYPTLPYPTLPCPREFGCGGEDVSHGTFFYETGAGIPTYLSTYLPTYLITLIVLMTLITLI